MVSGEFGNASLDDATRSRGRREHMVKVRALWLLWILWVATCATGCGVGAQTAANPLPSWNDSPSKKAIVDFVAKVTQAGGPDFVPVSERIATFDNDGTLWAEQPIYVQAAFALDRVKALASQHPEWKQQQPFDRSRTKAVAGGHNISAGLGGANACYISSGIIALDHAAGLI